MPTYEYACAKCGHTFERFQSIADKPLRVCPADVCPDKNWGKGRVKRQIGAGAGLLFKGSGFYITDYRSEGYKEAAKKESPAPTAASTPSTGGSGATGGGDGKPASTTPAPAKPAKAKPAKA